MPTIHFQSNRSQREGYLAFPQNPNGRAIFVLHAWWGLTPFFKSLCDRLAAEGFAVFAPDLFHSKTADTIEAAYQLEKERDFHETLATAKSALVFFRQHHAVQGKQIGTLGFSLGAIFTLLLHETSPDSFGAITLFYGGSEMDLSKIETPLLCHFAEIDEFESLENVQKMTLPNGTIHIYPGTKHWFFEDNRPEFDRDTATLAWERTLAFLNQHLT